MAGKKLETLLSSVIRADEEEEEYETTFNADEVAQMQLARFVFGPLTVARQRALEYRRPKDIWKFYTLVRNFLHLSSFYLPRSFTNTAYNEVIKEIERVAYDEKRGSSRWGLVLRYSDELSLAIEQMLRAVGVLGRRRRKEQTLRDEAIARLKQIVESHAESEEDELPQEVLEAQQNEPQDDDKNDDDEEVSVW